MVMGVEGGGSEGKVGVLSYIAFYLHTLFLALMPLRVRLTLHVRCVRKPYHTGRRENEGRGSSASRTPGLNATSVWLMRLHRREAHVEVESTTGTWLACSVNAGDRLTE